MSGWAYIGKNNPPCDLFGSWVVGSQKSQRVKKLTTGWIDHLWVYAQDWYNSILS